MTTEKTRFSPFLKQCYVTSTVGINLINQGCLVGFPAILLPQFYLPNSDIESNKDMDSWIAASIAITLFIGGLIIPLVMGPLGRKPLHFIVTSLATVGWFITCIASNVETILVARIIGGLALGMTLPLRSVLIGEYTSPKNRGAFLTTISLTQGLGVFFVHSFGARLSWRLTSVACLFIPLTSFVMTVFIPESPSWLVSKRRFDECKTVFRWLRGNEEEPELEAMIRARMEFDETNANKKNFIYKIIGNVHKPEFYKPIILMLHMSALIQFSGAVVTATFATIIIKLIMNPDVDADIWMLALDTERILINTLAIFVINKVKRRTMVFGTVILCVFSQLGIATFVRFRNSGLVSQDVLWLPGGLMIMHFFSIAIGMIPLPNVIAGEVYPLEYKSIGGSITLIAVAASTFTVLKTFLTLVDLIGISGTYGVYAMCLTYCAVVIWFIMPETKDRTLQDIEDEYRGKKVVSNSRNNETEVNK